MGGTFILDDSELQTPINPPKIKLNIGDKVKLKNGKEVYVSWVSKNKMEFSDGLKFFEVEAVEKVLKSPA